MYKEIETLLALSQKGDRGAKEELLFKLKPLIISSIKRYYNKIEKYDDLIQEGYEIILISINEYDTTRGVYYLGYVKTMLKYHYLNKYKEKLCSSLNEPINEGEGEIIDLIEGYEKDPIDSLVEIEEKKQLYESLSCLTERQKGIIVDFYINKLSIDRIADKLGISYRTVVNTKTVGINKLRKVIVK